MHPLLERLVRLPILSGPAKQILDSDVYLYQFKINLKAPFRGVCGHGIKTIFFGATKTACGNRVLLARLSSLMT
jgi:hypothetical protein